MVKVFGVLRNCADVQCWSNEWKSVYFGGLMLEDLSSLSLANLRLLTLLKAAKFYD